MTFAEDVLETLGDEQITRQEAVHQLIYDVLVEPIGHLNLPTSLVERNIFETHQMRVYGQERPEVEQCRRVAKLWFRWVEYQGMEYPQGIEGTWTRIWELVTVIPRIKEANTNYLAQLLVPPPPPVAGVILSPQQLAVATYSSEGSNSVTGPLREENAE